MIFYASSGPCAFSYLLSLGLSIVRCVQREKREVGESTRFPAHCYPCALKIGQTGPSLRDAVRPIGVLLAL